MRFPHACLAALSLLLASLSAPAAVTSETIVYRDGETELEGTLVYDAAAKGARDGVLVFHEWGGPGAYEKSRAEQLAGMGYVAFVADLYGKGVRPATPEACRAEAMKYYGDRELTRRRAALALQMLKQQRQVFQQEFVAIGYCFGGMVALELARSGANLAGAVSFHGSPDTPAPDGSRVKCPLLVLHGADDPHVKQEQLQSFEKEMAAAGAKFEVVSYPGAVHRFTNPDAGDDVASGVAYDKEADEKSWAKFEAFLEETLK